MESTTVEARTDYLHMFVKHDFSNEASKANLKTFLSDPWENGFPEFQSAAIESTCGTWYENTKIINIEKAGHYSMQEMPALYASIVEAFLNKQYNKNS